MHKNMNLVLKHKCQQKLLNLWHLFLLIFTKCVDFEVELQNVTRF